MDYLSLEPPKGNIENVLLHTLVKPKQLKPQQEFCGTISFVIMVFLRNLFLTKVEILSQI